MIGNSIPEFNNWFNSHYSEWLRMMRNLGEMHEIDRLRNVSKVAWEAACQTTVKPKLPRKWIPSQKLVRCPGTWCNSLRSCEFGDGCDHDDEAFPHLGFVLNPDWNKDK